MRKTMVAIAAAVAVFAGGWLMGLRSTSEAGAKSGPWLAHMVYFTLKDDSPAAQQKLVTACKKHLSGHKGEVFFAAGTLCEDLKRDVNDTDWHVGLHIVFKDKAAHDAYQVAPRHNQFIDENKDNWKKVRVFDSYVSK